MSHFCKFCNKEFEKGIQLGGHISGCKLNPTSINRNKKISLSSFGKKTSIETKSKLSVSMKNYFSKNPDKLPYKLYHSSKESWIENIFKNKLIKENIINWKQEYNFSIYSFDFAFENLMLAIELDGGTHQFKHVKCIDYEKEKLANEYGWTVIRFTGIEIKHNLDYCISVVKNYINSENKISLKYKTPHEKYTHEVNLRKLEKLRILEDKKNKILNSNINFNKNGWILEVSNILNIKPQCIHKWMKNNMLEFYNSTCYKRKYL